MRTLLRKHLIPACAYLLLTIVFTYPQILRMSSGCVEHPLYGSNDQYLHMWDAWWVKAALFDFGTTPYHTHLLNYPVGASLALQEIGVLNGLLIAPFQFALDEPHGLILGYNTAIILTFLLSALGMYALALDITGSRSAAFIAGAGFAFMPYRAMYITTLNLLSTGWIPLYVLFFRKTLQRPSVRNAMWAAIFFACALHSSFMYPFFLMLFSAVFLLANLVVEPAKILNKPVMKGLGLLSLFCFLAVLPNLLLILAARTSWEQPSFLWDVFSANLLGYIVPSDRQLLYRLLGFTLPSADPANGVGGYATFISFTLLALFVYGIVKTSRKETLPWLITFLVFLIFSLGTKLNVGPWHGDFRMPYYFLKEWMPFSSAMRTPFRFVVLERTALIVIAAYGMKHLFMRYRVASEGETTSGAARLRKPAITVGLTLLLVSELFLSPFRYVKADVPDIYFEISKQEEEFAVVDLPVVRYRDIAKYMFYQTVHRKPIPIGIINRPQADLTQTTGEIIEMLKTARRVDAALLETLRQYDAGYVIVHDFQGEKDRVTVYELLSAEHRE